MESRWNQLQAVASPVRQIQLYLEFERDFPGSEYSHRLQRELDVAQRVVAAEYAAGLSSELFEEAVGDDSYRRNLQRASRGDKEAAYGLAGAYLRGSSGVAADARRMQDWLRFSAELGHASASWELAQIYNRSGRIADAAHFEKRAVDLGYRPPPRLSTRDY